MFWKIDALRNFAKFKGKQLCRGHFLIKISIKKTQAEVLSCEFCEILKNNLFTEHLRVTAFAVEIIFELLKQTS